MKLSKNLSVGFFLIFNQFLVSQSIENPNILKGWVKPTDATST